MNAELEARLDRAMKPKRARKPKQSPVARFCADLCAALTRLDNAIQPGGGVSATRAWVNDYGEPLYLWTFASRLDASEKVAALFDGIREACR